MDNDCYLYVFSFGVAENVLKFDFGVTAELCHYVKNYLTVYFKWMNFIVM